MVIGEQGKDGAKLIMVQDLSYASSERFVGLCGRRLYLL